MNEFFFIGWGMGLWDGSGGCLCGRYGVLHEIILSLMGPYNHQPLNISGVLQVGDIVDPDPVPEDDDDDEEEEKPKPAKKPRKVYPPLLWASSLGVGGSVSWIWASWSAWMGSSFFFQWCIPAFFICITEPVEKTRLRRRRRGGAAAAPAGHLQPAARREAARREPEPEERTRVLYGQDEEVTLTA